MLLVRIIKNWDWPDLRRQSPGQSGIWDGIRFTDDDVEESDFVVMLNNNMRCESIVNCAPGNIWALMQEPYVRGFTDWMAEGHKYFSKVYTHYRPSESLKYVTSHPALPWHVNRTFDQLSSPDIPEKTKALSWIVGNARDLPGHLKRLSFLKFMQNQNNLDIDLFGRAVRVIDDKWDGLAPYRYSLAIENTCSPDYWTEKIADCFLSWTIPLYYGCTNLEKYFPEESFIRVDIEQPEAVILQIQSILKNNEWEKRLPALKKARELVLNEYQLFPHLVKQIKLNQTTHGTKMKTVIPPYRKSIRTHMIRAIYKMNMAMLKRREQYRNL